MDYELANALKNAGFPQELKVNVVMKHEGSHDFVKYPTLSELIAACGEEFVLEKVNSGGLHSWTAGTFIDRNGEIEHAQTAETPEEAVAELWLVLNKPQ